MIANGPSPPGDGALSSRIVADTDRVDAQGPTGRHSPDEVVALRDDDQLREIEDSFGPQTRLVRVKSPRVSNHLLRRQTCVNQVAAHGGRLIKLRRQVIARDDDHLNQSGIIKALCKIKTSGQESGRRAVWVNLCSEHQGYWRRRHIGLGVDVARRC